MEGQEQHSDQKTQLALSGIRVLDFGRYIAGPNAALLLAEQGADVIKIEPPQGDPCRGERGFIVWNRSKRGMRLDLKQDEGRRIAHELAKDADVIIENFRPGVADRLGIGYETIRQLNPRIVYCSISGFGQRGPYRDVPGWDPIVSAMSGACADSGGEGKDPVYFVLPLPSYYASMMAAFAVTIALHGRITSGQGEWIDISMFNCMVSVQKNYLTQFEGKVKVRWYFPRGLPLYGLFQAGDDKWFLLGVGNLTFFMNFCLAMGHEEWLVDDPCIVAPPWLINPPRDEEIRSILDKTFATKTREEWLEFLRGIDVPCSPVLPVDEYMEDPQILANDMVAIVEEPGLGKVREMGVPVKLSQLPGHIKGPSPSLGQHTHDVLSGLGYSERDIARLQSNGVI